MQDTNATRICAFYSVLFLHAVSCKIFFLSGYLYVLGFPILL